MKRQSVIMVSQSLAVDVIRGIRERHIYVVLQNRQSYIFEVLELMRQL